MIESGVTAAASRDDFLTLLVTQLKHQDPLKPVEQDNFIGQLAQFSTLEGIESLNSSFSDLLQLSQITQGVSIIGKEVTYQSSSSLLPVKGIVTGVTSRQGVMHLIVGADTIPLYQVQSVGIA